VTRRYYTGQCVLPTDGSAVAVCYVGAAGCLIHDVTGTGTSCYVGGPDVTVGNGFLLLSDSFTPIPGLPGDIPAAVVPAPPPEPPALLYACTDPGKTVTLYWLSGQPPAGG